MSDELAMGAAPRVEVTLHPALVRLFPGAEARLELPAATVCDVIDALDARWPGMSHAGYITIWTIRIWRVRLGTRLSDERPLGRSEDGFIP